jgi:hypothetical protein
MKVSKHFFTEDFVPKIIQQQFGDKAIWFISPFMVNHAELLWTRFGKQVIINNWKDGGNLQNRGFRIPDTLVGGNLSQHKLKSAIDTNVVGITPEEVYNDIKINFGVYSKIGLTTVEDIAFTTGKVSNDLSGWNHADCRTTNINTLLIVKP